MYERFSDRARKVMQLANQEAQRFNHEYIGTEHILLGLVNEDSGVAANVLKNLNIDLQKIRLEVERIIQHGPGGEQVVIGRFPHTPKVKKVIDYAVEEARALGHNYVGTEHILLALMRVEESVAAQALMNLGVKIQLVRDEVRNLLGHNSQDEIPPKSPEASPHDPRDKELDEEIERLIREKEAAVMEQDFERASALRDQVQELQRRRGDILPTPSQPNQSRYDLFTQPARMVMMLASGEARRFNHQFIETEHILLGLARAGSRVTAKVLKELSIDLNLVRLGLEKILQPGLEKPESNWNALSPKAMKVIQYSIEEAQKLSHKEVGPEHILLGLLREEEGLAAQVLTNMGVKIQPARDEVQKCADPIREHKIPKELQPGSSEIYPVSDLIPADIPEIPLRPVPPQQPASLYARFTDRARKVMQLANQEAQRFNHEYIGTEHILLGLVKESSGIAANVLQNLGIDLQKIRLEVEKIVQHGSGGEQVVMGRLPQTPRARKVIDFAEDEARMLNHDYVGTEHLLLGLLREQEGVAAQVLIHLGLKLVDIREEVLNLLLEPAKGQTAPERAKPATIPVSPQSDVARETECPHYEPLTVYQIELIHERIRRLEEQKIACEAANDLVQAGQFQAEADGLNSLLELYFRIQGQR
jgi:ATP-dependent Clp protease ATP-binding subunit ClpA